MMLIINDVDECMINDALIALSVCVIVSLRSMVSLYKSHSKAYQLKIADLIGYF